MISGTTTAAAAGTWTLGDRTVNRLGFGAMRLTGTGGMGRGDDRDPDASAAVVRRAVELGVNHIDTAGFYFSASAAPTRSSAPRSRRTPTTSRSSPRSGPGATW